MMHAQWLSLWSKTQKQCNSAGWAASPEEVAWFETLSLLGSQAEERWEEGWNAVYTAGLPFLSTKQKDKGNRVVLYSPAFPSFHKETMEGRKNGLLILEAIIQVTARLEKELHLLYLLNQQLLRETWSVQVVPKTKREIRTSSQ